MAKKALKTYEKERGIMFTGDVDLDARLNDEEFGEFLVANDSVGVDHEARIEFLKNNGYEVNRNNMVDSTLSVRSNNINSEEQ